MCLGGTSKSGSWGNSIWGCGGGDTVCEPIMLARGATGVLRQTGPLLSLGLLAGYFRHVISVLGGPRRAAIPGLWRLSACFPGLAVHHRLSRSTPSGFDFDFDFDFATSTTARAVLTTALLHCCNDARNVAHARQPARGLQQRAEEVAGEQPVGAAQLGFVSSVPSVPSPNIP